MRPDGGWNGVLGDSERLLWHDRPDGGIAIGDFLTARLPFGVVFTLFALFWIAATSWIGRDVSALDVFPLFGLPFVLIGLHLVIGVPIWDAYERSRSWYALTDQAAYVATEILGRRKLRRYPISSMNALELEDSVPGTVWFNQDVQVYRKRRRRPGDASMRRTYTSTTKTGFKRIGAARAVYGLIVRELNTLEQTASS